MRRRKTGGKALKAQRLKTLKRRNAPKTSRRRSSLAAGKQINVARLTRELAEAREREAATSEVLRVISSSSSDLKPVFDAMLENATRLCAAKFGSLYLWEHDGFRTIAMHNAPPAFVEARRRTPFIRSGPHSMLGRVASTMQAVHIPDALEDEGYINRTH